MDRGVDSGSPMDDQAPDRATKDRTRAPNPDEQDSIDLRAEWRARHEGTTFRERMDRPDRYGLLLALIVASLIVDRGAQRRFGGAGGVGGHARPDAGLRATNLARAAGPVQALDRLRALVRRSWPVFVSRDDTQFAREAIAAIIFVLLMAVLLAIIRRMTIHLTISLATVLRGLCIYLLIGSFSTRVQLPGCRRFHAALRAGSERDGRRPPVLQLHHDDDRGYGDLTPVGNLPRMLAATEALMGQIYLVTAVALLVGNLGRERRRRQPQMTSGHHPCGRCDLRRH